MNATRRVALALAVLVALAGCIPIATPSTPLTYSWVMVHDYQRWGVQIGPKVDGSGTHVAVYAWQNCHADYRGCDWWFFHEYEALEPGSVHGYSIVRGDDGWHLLADGRLVAVLDPGNTNVHFELGSEATAS